MALTTDNYEGAVGQNVESMNAYVMAEKTKLTIYDNKEFTQTQSWNIPTYNEANNKSDIEILYMSVSEDQTKIGVVLGRVLIKDEQEITEIVIYK